MISLVLVNFKTKEICNKAVEKEPYLLLEVSDHFKAEQKCVTRQSKKTYARS